MIYFQSVIMLSRLLIILLAYSFTEAQASKYEKIKVGLTTVPHDIPTNTTVAKLNGNSLTVITSSDFSHLVNLIELFLSSNEISSIASDAFNNTVLQKLVLSKNPIKTVQFFAGIDDTLTTLSMATCEISSATWDHVIHYSNLAELSLELNQITTVPNVTRSANSLAKLQLLGNQIKVLEAAKLDGCHKLQHLILSYNPTTHVDGLLKLNKLEKLELNDNMLNHFPNLSGLPELHTLVMSKSTFLNIPNDCFANNSKLNSLFLSKNNMNKMPNLDGARSSLEKLIMANNYNITVIPTDYFKDCTKLREITLNGLLVTSLAFGRSIGPSVGKIYMKGGILTDVPADTFPSASGVTEINLERHKISHFDMSNIQYMPLLTTIFLWKNNLTKIGNAYDYCKSKACSDLKIDVTDNQIPCDRHMCWAKRQTTIDVNRDPCPSGEDWNDLTLNDLPCPNGNVFLSFQLLTIFPKSEGISLSFPVMV